MNFLRNIMTGRNGPDYLGVALLLLSIAFSVTHALTRLMPFMYISYIIIGIAFFRMLSRNIKRRRAENDMFIRYFWPLKTKIHRAWINLKQRKTHKLFKCPSCRNTLRIPRHKGKLQVTCPKCGERFYRKT